MNHSAAEELKNIEQEHNLHLDRPDITDSDMAGWIATKHMDGRLHWTAGLGWLEYERGVWSAVSEAHVHAVVRDVFERQITDEFVAGSVGKQRMNELARLKVRSRIVNVAALARGLVEADAADFDTHDDLLNCPNGVVDLTTGELLPHDPKYLFTKITSAEYIRGTGNYDWYQALKAVPDDVRGWLQIRVGQAITGHTPDDDKIVLLKGGGANGKSTILHALDRALGSFSGLIPEKTVFSSAGDHPTELMPLRGLRLAILEETLDDQALSTKRLKDITAPAITARAVHKDNIVFKATHSLFLSSNYLPKVKETDHGTWRRLALVEFPFRFRAAGQEKQSANDLDALPGLRERLTGNPSEEALAWAVEGAVEWYAQSSRTPEPPTRVQAAVTEWREQSDELLSFMQQELVFDPACRTPITHLYQRYELWKGMAYAMTETNFKRRFLAHGEVIGHGVTSERSKSKSLTGVSLLEGQGLDHSKNPTYAVGVRFK